VLSDGFFEWRKLNAREKIPYRIFLKDESLFAMAGIWDTWKGPDGEPVNSFSIITTGPNALMENIHDRMPVILPRTDERTWLDDTPEQDLLAMLKPFPAEQMTAHPVSKLVNSPVNDRPEVLEAVEYDF
jgi:putative SOS response-associated peptidase YedK